MDFLLECIGFPPGGDQESLGAHILAAGEAAPWRGAPEDHLRLGLGHGLELRLDREEPDQPWTLLPYYRVDQRLRVAVDHLEPAPDSPFDVLLTGWVAPPLPGDRDPSPGAYRISTWLTDARRLPPGLPCGHVLAVSIAGFALGVDYVGPNSGVREAAILDRPHGAWIQPLGAPDSPGGCAEVSLRVREIRHLRNELTGRLVDVIIADAPERPLALFVSPWQLESDGLPAPRPGWRIEGTFLFSGRLSGGLPGPPRRARRVFG